MLSRYSCLQCTFFFYSKCFHFFSVWIVRCIKFQVFFVSQICLYYLVSITLKILCIVNNVSHVRLVFLWWQLYCFKIIKKWVQSKSNSFARNHDNFFLFSGRKIATTIFWNKGKTYCFSFISLNENHLLNSSSVSEYWRLYAQPVSRNPWELIDQLNV